MIKGAKGIISHWNAIFMSFAFLAIRLLFRYNYAMIVLWLEETILSEYYKFFQNKKCEYFPCHKGIPEEDFNCLFCYCPLYTLGKSCGGNCEYLKNGIKSCINCGFPHHRKNYDKVTGRFQEIAAVMAASDKEQSGDMSRWFLKRFRYVFQKKGNFNRPMIQAKHKFD